MKKTNLLKDIKNHIYKSIKLDSTGWPDKAVKENKLALACVKRLQRILESNDAIFWAHSFLKGESNITRKKKR